MAYINESTDLNIVAKLTPYGREQILQQGSNLFKYFTIGDSDANYTVEEELESGTVPAISGNKTLNNEKTGSANTYKIRSKIYYSSGNFYKEVEESSGSILTSNITIPYSSISSTVYADELNRTELDENINNLFKSFNLPITDSDKAYFTTVAPSNGGYANTALSGLNQDNILLLSIDGGDYGEAIDGKSLKLTVSALSQTYDIYGTFGKSLTTDQVLDAQTRDNNTFSEPLGDNVVFLFSDEIQKPNNDSSKSWSTGHNNKKRPYSVGKKEKFNFYASPSEPSQITDKCIGVAHLDKGMIIITEPTIVNNFSSVTELAFSSYYTEVAQNVTCVINRGEFTTTTNTTYGANLPFRISEVGIYDENKELVAIGKSDRQILKSPNSFLGIGVKITL